MKGKSFSSVGSAFWIDVPPDPTDPASRPTQIYVSEAALTCDEISHPLWDKVSGVKQLLEITLDGSSTKTYTVLKNADASYLAGASSSHNPSATGGTVTILQVSSAKSIQGSFDIKFSSGTLKGSFDAQLCPTGVEP